MDLKYYKAKYNGMKIGGAGTTGSGRHIASTLIGADAVKK